MRKIIVLAPADQLERKDNQGWLQSTLERHLHKLVGQKEWISVKPTLALLIYGLVMFPSVPDTVGLEAMRVFYKVYKWKVDPVPAILGDTFIALSNCHKKGFHKIRCCAHLLYVWMATHVHAVKYQAFNNRVMIDFNSVALKEDSVAQWKVTLENLIPADYRWMCYWCPQKSMIIRCGSYNNVPLLGTNGCFFYTPELVLRQLGRMQIRPADEPKSIICLYGDDNDLVKKVKEAWDKLVLREDQQRGIARVRSTSEYDSWRADRVGEVTISPPLPREECLSSREKELQSTIETLREQMNIIDGKRQDALIEVMRKNHEIEVLKKELKIEKEAYVPATLKRAKTEAYVQIHKLREQLDAQREAMATETGQKTELKERLEDFRRAVHLRDKRIAELERDLRMSQQHATEGQNQVDQLIERVSHLEEVQRRMNEYQEALARAKAKTKWYKRKAHELQSECNNMGLELNWKEEDKQKELEAARKTIEEVEECKEMWRHRSISLLGHWETLSYGWLKDFEFVYQESIRAGASIPTEIRIFFNNYQNTAQGIRNWRESMGWMNPEPQNESTFMEENSEEEDPEEEDIIVIDDD
ncbi:hypothetical protein Lal_00011290 [Lupinus albus]|nr:hypothetical protein Lal_00011290 [Lupinus albus]